MRMTYAKERIVFDADSHIMELPSFLMEFADPDARELMPRFRGGPVAKQLEEMGEIPGHSAERVAEMLALGDDLLRGPKNFMALGAFNRDERVQALDLLGFQKQLVFPTFGAGAVFWAKSVEARYAIAKAANRAMAAFCDADRRMLGVAILPFDDVESSVAEVEHLASLGLRAAWVPHALVGGRSPGHLDYDPIWTALASARVPFALHIGGASIQLPPDYMNNGRPIPKDWLGSAENVRGKDMMALHHSVEKWIGCLALDGVLDRHPNLRGVISELGAAYVPSMLERLDYCVHGWAKSDPELAKLTRKPSEMIVQQMAFTPFPHENVGRLIAQSDPALYLFSSDYPHIEGGRTPVERFDSTLLDTPEAAKDQFYFKNFAGVFALGA
jgi:predicted TIM-barrel fold metal-dependent hydrolase